MKQLRIYFKNDECDQINWCYLSDNAEAQIGHDLNDALKTHVSNATEIVFVVPQYWVYETNIDVSDKNNKQLLSAAAYQLEDQLAEDVDLLHFAQGSADNDVVPFVAITHYRMSCLQAFEKQNSITATHIINEMALCAKPNDGELNINEYDGHYLINSNDKSFNTICQAQQLDFFLNRYQQNDADIVINRLFDEQIDLLQCQLDLNNCVNLKQKDYSQKHVWQKVAKNFVLPAIFLLLTASFLVFNQWQENELIKNQIDSIKKEQFALIASNIKDSQKNSNAKVQLIKALQKQRDANQQGGFLSGFYEFLKAKQTIKTIELIKIDYRNEALTVNVTAENLQQLDQLIVELKKQFKVTVSQMDSSNDTSQGRFILEQL